MALSHIDAGPGEIADLVLMPGDPLRGQRIAEDMLRDVKCHNRTRNMLGFTGTHRAVPVSVQASGMGAPSITIYATELFDRHGVRTIVRVGTCAALSEDVELGDLVLAMAAATDSRLADQWVPGIAYAPTASYPLLAEAVRSAANLGHRAHVGQVMTSDVLYGMDVERLVHLADMGVLGLDMETAALYAVAASRGAQALSVLTVADRVDTGEGLSSSDRESRYRAMVEVALDAALAMRDAAPAGAQA